MLGAVARDWMDGAGGCKAAISAVVGAVAGDAGFTGAAVGAAATGFDDAAVGEVEAADATSAGAATDLLPVSAVSVEVG